MPHIVINLKKSYGRTVEESILNAVHKAQTEAFKTPENDRNIRLMVHEPHRFATPLGTSDNYALVEVDMFVGRTLEAKRKFYRAIVDNLREFGIPPAEIRIILKESPRENWGVRGGIPASEVDLGFKVEI